MRLTSPVAKARKEKGHINVAKLTSLLSGMMITNARLSYIQTLGEQKSFIVYKKISKQEVTYATTGQFYR
ncbi:hypothetical protein C3408_07060 [Candidatus Pantoea alvi]|nr:hypothetical protein C3408_07060 [Pantoea alvi]